MIVAMTSSQHSNPALTVRPERPVKAGATAVLSDRGLEMEAFITACLVALADDPDRFLAALRPYWPPVKPRGRPRNTQEK